MVNTMPKVTVLIAAYNEEKNIEKCLESVLDQTFKDYKILLLDDGSTDETVIIAEDFMKDKNIDFEIIRSETNLGKISIINRSVFRLNTEYIAILDADDQMYPHRLSEQVEYLDRNVNCDILGGQQCLQLGNGSTKILKPPTTHAQICTSLLSKTTMLNPTVTFRMESCLRDGVFLNEDAILSEDFRFFVDCFTRGLQFHNLNSVACNYHFSEQKNWQSDNANMMNSLRCIFKTYLTYLNVKFTHADIETLLLFNMEKKIQIRQFMRFLILQIRILRKHINTEHFSFTTWIKQNYQVTKLLVK